MYSEIPTCLQKEEKIEQNAQVLFKTQDFGLFSFHNKQFLYSGKLLAPLELNQILNYFKPINSIATVFILNIFKSWINALVFLEAHSTSLHPH